MDITGINRRVIEQFRAGPGEFWAALVDLTRVKENRPLPSTLAVAIGVPLVPLTRSSWTVAPAMGPAPGSRFLMLPATRIRCPGRARLGSPAVILSSGRASATNAGRSLLGIG